MRRVASLSGGRRLRRSTLDGRQGRSIALTVGVLPPRPRAEPTNVLSDPESEPDVAARVHRKPSRD